MLNSEGKNSMILTAEIANIVKNDNLFIISKLVPIKAESRMR